MVEAYAEAACQRDQNLQGQQHFHPDHALQTQECQPQAVEAYDEAVYQEDWNLEGQQHFHPDHALQIQQYQSLAVEGGANSASDKS